MDFTEEIALTKKEQFIYQLLRSGLYAVFIMGSFYVAFIILFPTQYLTFNFANFNSTKNTLIRPRIENTLVNKGRLSKNEVLFFDAGLIGHYSTVKVTFNLNKKSPLPNSGNIQLNKSYQSFLYPEVATDDKVFPEIASLISHANSVYIKNGDFIYPFDSAVTFEAMGYNWKDVLPVGSDEIANLKKGKALSLLSAHPDGTLFEDLDTKNLYIIENGNRILLQKNELSEINTQITPIIISSSSTSISENCSLIRNLLNKRRYSCNIPIEKLQSLIGKDYEFKITFNDDVKIDSIDVRFEQNINWLNLKDTASLIITRIKNNYAGE